MATLRAGLETIRLEGPMAEQMINLMLDRLRRPQLAAGH
jgi:hypothetical protein